MELLIDVVLFYSAAFILTFICVVAVGFLCELIYELWLYGKRPPPHRREPYLGDD